MCSKKEEIETFGCRFKVSSKSATANLLIQDFMHSCDIARQKSLNSVCQKIISTMFGCKTDFRVYTSVSHYQS